MTYLQTENTVTTSIKVVQILQILRRLTFFHLSMDFPLHTLRPLRHRLSEKKGF
jgi:hypothetical protein